MPSMKRILICCACLLLPIAPAASQDLRAAAEQAAPRTIVYDIPSQELAKALNNYAAASGIQVLYETSLTTGRRSATVKGSFSPEAALQALLAGSGLIGRRTDFDAFTITPVSPDNAAATPTQVQPPARFLAALQAGMLDALCRTDETRPGTYQIAVQIWINSDSNIERAVLLATTGDVHRDQALSRALRNVAIGMPPPPGMAQPVTLTIQPRSPLQGDECVGR